MLNVVRRELLLIPLVLAAALAFVGAFLLRFEFAIPSAVRDAFLLGLLTFIPLKAAVFWGFRLHAIRWRLVSMFDLFRLVSANVTALVLIWPLMAFLTRNSFPRSIYVLDAVLCFLATAGSQFLARVYWEFLILKRRSDRDARIVLIYGAGIAGSLLAKEIRSNPALRTVVLGFLDDDECKKGRSVGGIPVLGSGTEVASLIARFRAEGKPVSEIIIAMPSATAAEMRKAVRVCRAAGVPFRTVPGLAELLSGRISPQIREVSANDLLGREPVSIEEPRIRQVLAGQSVMVTGGCGSIGSELCRQIARFQPAKLVIFDQAESEMYMLGLELRRQYPELELATEVGDIVRTSRVQQAFARHAVSVVFHAAAYKHVPLMEENIAEAVENNIIGTYNVAHSACRNGVRHFVLISSDKAVNPTSIMGITKRIAEQIVAAMPLERTPGVGPFVSVRFGNVLGSAGSVIPIFRRQIAAGGPITVTHPEMRRYFMSVAEAVQLVLQASTMGEGSDVFVLDMGEPVRILDLATSMIRLSGFIPGEDIDIQFSGLRPGEKLYEELQLDCERILPTPHRKIMRFCSKAPTPQEMSRWLERMRILLVRGDGHALREHMLLLVPEYQGCTIPPKSAPATEKLRLATARAS